MEQKNRLIIVAAVTSLILFAMFTSFGRSMFALNTPKVVLPSAGPSGADSSASPDPALYQPGEVTPHPLTSRVAPHNPPTSERFWEGGSSSSHVEVWVDGGWSHIRQALPSGVVRHDLVGEETLYYWYEGSQHYQSTPADPRSPDLAQQIPTYETVLALDEEEITDAGYEPRGELSCICAAVQPEGSSVSTRFWVSVDSGLLVSAEMEEEGQLVYRMTAYTPVQSPCPAASFALPDGEVLHTPSG